MTIDRFLPALVLASLCAYGCPSAPSRHPPSGDMLITIPGNAPTNASSCDDRLAFALDAMDQLVNAANGACTSDTDCTLVFAETQCIGACQAPILADRLDAFREAQAAIDGRACTDYVEDGCIYSTPACLAVEAVCQAGRCAMQEPSR